MKEKQVYWVIIAVCIAAIATYFFTSRQVHAPVLPPVANVPYEGAVSLEGVSVCLPHVKSGGPQTLECAYGLRTDNGFNYALDTSKAPLDNESGPGTNKRIKIEGTLVTIEAISNDYWRKYDIKGIIQVNSFEAL